MIETRQSFKKALKVGMQWIAPELALTLLSIRSRRFIEKQTRELGLRALARQVANACDSRVRSGPFAGMRLDVEALPVHVAPKLLGTYEDELHECIETAIAGRPRVVLNVGCAEGYYAIGLATRLPDAIIYAFDADPKAGRATLRNAELNGVARRLRVSGAVRAARLEPLLRLGRSLVIMDCEGAEFELLDPRGAPSLAGADIIVELHPHQCPAIEQTLIDRFRPTHAIDRIAQSSTQTKLARARRPVILTTFDSTTAADERRTSDISWLYFRARNHEAQTEHRQ